MIHQEINLLLDEIKRQLSRLTLYPKQKTVRINGEIRLPNVKETIFADILLSRTLLSNRWLDHSATLKELVLEAFEKNNAMLLWLIEETQSDVLRERLKIILICHPKIARSRSYEIS
ncbi:MAG: hypothetical protein AAB664_01160 [Patescibacteria group bacterium]